MRDLTIKISVDNQAANRALKETDAALESIGKTGADVGGPSGGIAKVETTMGKLVALAGGVKGIEIGFRNLTNFARTSVTAFAEQESAAVRLTTALRAQGTATDPVIQQYEALAQAFQRTTTFSDDTITSMQALLVQVGGVMPGQMDAALTAATNLSAGLGIDLQASTMAVAKAFEGGGNALTRLLPNLKELIRDGATGEEVVAALNARFGDAALAQMDTYAGRTANLTNRWNDFQERVGNLVVTVLDPLLRIFEAMPASLQTVGFAVTALATALTPLTIGLAGFAYSFGTTIPAAFATFVGYLSGTLVPWLTGTLVPLFTVTIPAAFQAILPFLGPVGLIAAGVAAVLTAWYYWDEIVDIVMRVYTAVKEYFVDKFGPLVQSLDQKLKTVIRYFDDLYRKVVGFAEKTYLGVKSWLVDKFQGIVDSIKGKIDAVTGFFGDMYDKVVGQSFVPDMVRQVGDWFDLLDGRMVGPTQRVTQGVSGLFGGMLQGITGMLSGWASNFLPDWFNNIVNIVNQAMGLINGVLKIVNTFSGGAAAIPGLGGVASGVGGALGGVGSAVGGALGGVGSALLSAIPVVGPIAAALPMIIGGLNLPTPENTMSFNGMTVAENVVRYNQMTPEEVIAETLANNPTWTRELVEEMFGPSSLGAEEARRFEFENMAVGGHGRTRGPTWFYSGGNEDYAFSGEGKSFGASTITVNVTVAGGVIDNRQTQREIAKIISEELGRKVVARRA